ncbi:MAG: hypothetical protein QOI02_82 [Actinomycetota bacterium]|nr:hypothetical protein [Actinomycetota bacterium]
MQRVTIYWVAAFLLLGAAFGITVLSLNSSLYSAGGFVASYLDALKRHDATTARSLPGVLTSTGVSTELLTDAALGTLSGIRQLSDITGPGDVHTVSYSYRMGDQEGQTQYRVKRTGAFLGLFTSWSFETSPLATVAVTPLHDQSFRANGVTLTSKAKADAPSRYAVFVPGLYTFDHRSEFLTADPIATPVTDPQSVSSVQVNVQAAPAFVAEVNKQVREFLAKCATQRVLLPTGCPFGQTFDNRVVSTPTWKMHAYPDVQIVPGQASGTWLVPNTDASARLTVRVQSLFDGTITTFDKDVPFTVSYVISFLPDGELYIKAQYD